MQGELGLFKNPSSAKVKPQPNYGDTAMWIHMDAMVITMQSAMGRGWLTADPVGLSWEYLAAREVVESTAHTWTDYESIMGRMAQLGAELNKGAREVGKGALVTASAVAGGMMSLESTVRQRVAADFPKLAVYNYRVDAPLYYKESERRKFDLVFNLVEEGSPYTDIIQPVRLLQKCSAPQSQGILWGIKPPYIFNVYSTPNKTFLYLRYAALTQVNMIWKDPYYNGLPTGCELQLTFVDMTPLFDDSFDQNMWTVREYGIDAGDTSAVTPAGKSSAGAPGWLGPASGILTGEK
jgi:hypothetical protein